MTGTAVSIVLSDRLSASAVRLARSLPAPRPGTALTPPELSVLAAISSAGSIAARDLARYEEVTAATMSRLVASLERKGLVRRKRDRKDARLHWIALTALGGQRVKDGRLRQIAPLAAAIAKLDKSKRAALTEAADILESLVSALHDQR
jgi:DNA-binding MarR family transcriptional regulator